MRSPLPRTCARRLAALAAIFAAAVVPASAIAQPTNSLNFTAGAWRGGPVADSSGQYLACAIFAPAGGGAQVFFRLSSSFEFALGLINRRWNLPTETAVPMTYRIDNGPRTEVQARVPRNDTLLIDVADRESIFQEFRRGLWLYLSAQGSNGRISLKGTSVALERLRVCATALAAATPRESTPEEPPPQPPSRGK